MLKIVVCVSGSGTNLQAIINQIQSGVLKNVEIVGVISNNHSAYALERARQNEIKDLCISPKDFENREECNECLVRKIGELEPDLIVLAGYLVTIPEKLVQLYRNKIINVHPSLIPSFCGVGYYGLKVHEAALTRGVKIVGATIHYVDEGTDTGPIILQKAVSVLPSDDAKSLQKRVMEEAEWEILPKAIDLIAKGQVTIRADYRVDIIE